uniref:Aurein-3.2 n=2 Tax=Ranoidea TaxID=2777416 RepID=AUR32_RANAE|nr:RecName: Full=Aurein-3.2 [Ranoidea raniformis]P69023.1 RecName: Full=Aurein-3.2 [Ranoidea aurea]
GLFDIVKKIAGHIASSI